MTEVVFVSQLHEEKATLLLHIRQHDVLSRARTDFGWNYTSKYKIFYKNWLEKRVEKPVEVRDRQQDCCNRLITVVKCSYNAALLSAVSAKKKRKRPRDSSTEADHKISARVSPA